MRLHRRLTAALFCVLLTIQAYPASRKALEKRISTILSTPDLTRGFWGMEVVSLSTGKVLYSQNGDKLFIPASNTKLFTTAAALALIGSDYKFRTSVETNGVLDKQGRLTGGHVLIGRGDRAFVVITPFANYYRIDNRIIPTPAGTGRKIFINREPGSTVLTLWGNMPLDDAGANEDLAIEDPAEFAATVFRQLLESRGIAVYGRQRTRHTELASLSTFSVTALAPARGGDETSHGFQTQSLVLASNDSKPLIEDLRVINKVSQNLHAEILLRLLGREKGTAGTVEGGLEVLRGFLNQAGLSPDQYGFYDGPGLSRENLVTPHAVVQLLRYAALQPWGATFRDTLPVGGLDGSLSDRFKNVAEQGHIYAKTGSLGGVKSLSGYATTQRGDRIAFSILSNNFNLPNKRVTDTIDAIIEAIVEDAASRKE